MPRRSGLAIAAFVLGILSLFTCGLTAIPAVVLGIISFILVEKSGGRLTGTPFAVLGVVIPVLIFFVLLHPMLLNIRQKASRMSCGTNMAEIGMSILTYANDYEGQFPRSAGKGGQWAMAIQHWRGNNRYVAYGLAADSSGGRGTISSCFYLLVKYGKVMPKSFICPGDSGTMEFKPAVDGAGDIELTDLWDFGSEPTKRCSYSYHQPFSQYALTTSSEPGMAVAADRNPWIEFPAGEGKSILFAQFLPTGRREAIRIGNALQHQEDGQNVLFVDNHVSFERNSFCGFNDDNIYTFWGPDIRRGSRPVVPISQPMDAKDSLLVHDGYGSVSGQGR